MRTSSGLWFSVGATLFLLALPTLPEQIRALAAMLGVLEAEWHLWNYVGVIVGLLLMMYSLHPAWKSVVSLLSNSERPLRITISNIKIPNGVKALVTILLFLFLLPTGIFIFVYFWWAAIFVAAFLFMGFDVDMARSYADSILGRL